MKCILWSYYIYLSQTRKTIVLQDISKACRVKTDCILLRAPDGWNDNQVSSCTLSSCINWTRSQDVICWSAIIAQRIFTLVTTRELSVYVPANPFLKRFFCDIEDHGWISEQPKWNLCGQSGIGRGFFFSMSDFFRQWHSAIAPCFIYLPLTLYQLIS